ncbi:MAG: RecX family transcriptional regulator [Ignavibacteriae bacterium]|nr:RecX family transcriptional regulator [Ignavibacteriota bacterium]
MRITRIETQQKRRDRVNVYADGEFAVGISKETLLRAALRVGDELTPERLSALQSEEGLFQTRAAAMRLLARRPRAERELRDRLREKEYADADIARVLAGLRTAGLVNDAEFARTYIRNTLILRPLGEIQLRQKLLIFGIERATVDDAIREELGAVDVDDIALAVTRKYLARSAGRGSADDPRKRRRLAAAMLARRGYAWTIITRVLKKLDLPEDDA